MADKKRLGILLFSTPYGSESADTTVKVAEAALKMGHQVSIFAYGDGVHGFTAGQKAKGMPNAEQNFSRLIGKGLDVQLCGTCLNQRGIDENLILKGARRSSLSNLCKLIADSNVFITFS